MMAATSRFKPVALVLIGAVADFAESVEEYGAAERILLLTLVETNVATTTQLGVLQPLERKESPFQLSQFAQGERQAILAGIGRELAQITEAVTVPVLIDRARRSSSSQ